MVLPLVPVVLGAGAIASALAGLKKGWDAKQNFSEAERWVAEAEQDWRRAATALETRRTQVCAELNALGMQRLQIISKSLSKFARLVNEVAASDFQAIHVNGIEVPIEVAPLQEIESASYQATEFLQHGIQSALSGVMVGAGVGQAVTMFGAASTGAAISGLSGAAATNATLAWLGGGSLASGGLGMAGGTAVLGGVAAGPFLLVMGYLAAGKSEEALTQARAHSTRLESAAEQLKSAGIALDAIEQRAKEVAWVLESLDERFQAASSRISRMVGRLRREREALYWDAGKPVPAELAVQKFDYVTLSEKDQDSFNLMLALGSALYGVAKIQILDSQGAVTEESENLSEKMQNLMEGA
uniref:Chemotaxis protein n=1 Tax=Variovorax paradoxus (strain S110) TaxID=543728 RepID=C5CL26_VARPS